MEKKKKFDVKGLVADFCFLIGTMVLGYVNFFVYGQYTAMVEAGLFPESVHRLLVAVTFLIVAYLYSNVIRLFVAH